MAPSFTLVYDRQVALAVLVLHGSLAAVVQEVFGLVEVLLLPCQQIQPCKRHLGDLVAGNNCLLPFSGTDFADDAVGILLSNVEELGAAGGLIMGACGIDHVAKVVEFMAAAFNLLPAFAAGP